MVNMNKKLSICEIYPAIQGEGPTAGEPAIFIRLSMCNLHCHWCLTKKTKIQTLSGIKSIKDVETGDQIFGYKDGEIVFTPVIRIFRKKVLYKELIKIITNKSKLQCTMNHKIYVEGRNYKRADSIDVGDLCKHVKGTDEVSAIKNDYTKNTSIDVYNLETLTNNYFANDLLVHNCDIPQTWNWIGTDLEHQDDIKYDPETEIIEMSADEIIKQIQEIRSRYKINRVILTGGEPLVQQKNTEFVKLINILVQENLIIEVETNGTIIPDKTIDNCISQFNVSPKLSGSGNTLKQRIRPRVYQFFIDLFNNYQDVEFKFVINDDKDLVEVEDLRTEFNIPRKMISLMPQCVTQEEAIKTSKWLMEKCMETGYKFCPRIQIYVYGNERKR